MTKQKANTEPKANTGEAQVLEEFKPTKQNVELYISRYIDDNVEDVLKEVFEDIKGYSLNGPYLVIQEHDDTQHVYRSEALSKIKITVTK